MSNPKAVKWAAGITAATVLVAGGVGIAYNAERGRMLVSQEAVDIANATSSPETVRFYEDVCAGVDKVLTSPDNVVAVAEQSVGEDSERVAQMYRDGLSAAASQMGEGIDMLQSMDATAPTVVRVDGVATDYAGALSEIIEAAIAARADADALAGDAGVWAATDPTEVTGVAQRAVETTGDGVNKVASSMSALQDNAPIYSEATLRDIQAAPVCSQIFNPDFAGEEAQREVVDGVVTAKDAVALANMLTSRELGGLSDLSDMAGVDAGDMHAYTVRVLDASAQVARDQADMLRGIDNPYNPDTEDEKFRATQEALGYLDGGDAAYTALADVLADWSDRLGGISPDDAEAFGAVAEEMSPKLREAQIDQAKFTTRAMTRMPVPTTATTEEIERRAAERDTEVDQRAVNIYRAVVRAQREFVQDMNAVAQAQTRNDAADALYDLATSAENNSEEVTRAVADAEPTFAAAHYAASLMDAAATARELNGKTSIGADTAEVSQQFVAERSEVGRALVEVLGALPSGGATGQEIDRVRTDEFGADTD